MLFTSNLTLILTAIYSPKYVDDGAIHLTSNSHRDERDHFQALTARLDRSWGLAQRRGHRFQVVIQREDAVYYASRLFEPESDLARRLPTGEVLTLGGSVDDERGHLFEEMWADQPHIDLSWSSARARLGGSEAALLIDGRQGIHPDALAAAMGVVRGGGLIVFCLPPMPPERGDLKAQLTVWPRNTSEVGHRFWETLWSACIDHQHIYELEPGLYCSRSPDLITPRSAGDSGAEAEVCSTLSVDFGTLSPYLRQCLTDHPYALEVIERCPLTREQQEVILTALTSHARQAFSGLALSALRGRGKSSALGMIAAVLLLTGEGEVGLTAPSLYSIEAVFDRAQVALELVGVNAARTEDALTSTAGVIRYWTPQQLWTRQVRPKILLIDEAAALPVPLLERLLEWRPSLVFATTTHGYEGTGRGFSLRFRPFLQQKLRKLYEPKLTQPLRWSGGDPVEAWMMSALMLEADVPLVSHQLSLSHYRYLQLSADDLIAHPSLTREVFGLLIHAHYRTQPSDLWRLFDAPNLTLHVLYSDEAQSKTRGVSVLAVALTSREGGLSAELAAQVYEGRVRPRGQLFAANLAVHLNCEEGAQLNLERVVRIATLPTQQGRGAGSALLAEVIQWAKNLDIDLIGSSFGATEQLTRFWLRAEMIPLRVGVRQSHVSGERSLLVARALSSRGQAIMDTLSRELINDFNDQLRGPLTNLEPMLVYTLYTALNHLSVTAALMTPAIPDTITERQWRALGAIAFAGRAYELAVGPAHALALHWLRHCPQDDTRAAPLTPLGRLVIMKIIQGQRWLEVTAELRLGSTSEAMKGLSAALRILFMNFAPQSARQWVKRFPQYHRPARLCDQLHPLLLTHQESRRM